MIIKFLKRNDEDGAYQRLLGDPGRIPRHLLLVQVFFTPQALRPFGTKFVATWKRASSSGERRRGAPASSAKEEEEKKRKRIMMRTSISKEKLENYRRHHQGVWPEVERGLRTHGVTLLTVKSPLSCSTSPGCCLLSPALPEVFLPGSSLLHHHPIHQGTNARLSRESARDSNNLRSPCILCPRKRRQQLMHTPVSRASRMY